MKYLIYSRVSTKEQDTETQNNLCYKLIEMRGDSTGVELFTDPDSSTSIPMNEREGLQRMMQALKKGVTVVVYDMDRLSRDIIEQVTIYREIKAKKAFITSVGDPHCDNEFKINIMAAVAQEEKRKIIQRTKDKLAEKAGRWERVGTAWYGYKVDETRLQLHRENAKSYKKPYLLIPDHIEQENIATMERLLEAGLSYGDIAKEMEVLGCRNRKGNPFQKTSIFRILARHRRRSPAPREMRYG